MVSSIHSAKSSRYDEQFQDPSVPFVEVCRHSTRDKCNTFQSLHLPRESHLSPLSANPQIPTCTMVHFKIRQFPQTEPSLGDCSYLNTCHHLDTCRYLHYELETPSPEQVLQFQKQRKINAQSVQALRRKKMKEKEKMLPPQWLDCDLRKIDVTVLGTFDVIMADPPWDSQSLRETLHSAVLADFLSTCLCRWC